MDNIHQRNVIDIIYHALTYRLEPKLSVVCDIHYKASWTFKSGRIFTNSERSYAHNGLF